MKKYIEPKDMVIGNYYVESSKLRHKLCFCGLDKLGDPEFTQDTEFWHSRSNGVVPFTARLHKFLNA